MLVFWTLFTKKSPEVKFEAWYRKLSTRQLISRLLGCSQFYRIFKALAKVISEFFMVISQRCQKMGDRTTKYLCLKEKERAKVKITGQTVTFSSPKFLH